MKYLAVVFIALIFAVVDFQPVCKARQEYAVASKKALALSANQYAEVQLERDCYDKYWSTAPALLTSNGEEPARECLRLGLTKVETPLGTLSLAMMSNEWLRGHPTLFEAQQNGTVTGLSPTWLSSHNFDAEIRRDALLAISRGTMQLESPIYEHATAAETRYREAVSNSFIGKLLTWPGAVPPAELQDAKREMLHFLASQANQLTETSVDRG